MVLAAVASLLLSAGGARAASWKGLEPFVSKRADVERVLGAPVSDRLAEDGTMRFNVSGGSVTVFFVTPKFVATKHLSPALEGTILQIVLSHNNATDTPESMNLVKNSAFKRDAKGEVEVFTNEKEGVVYTFVGSRLKTTRYAYSEQQLARIQRGEKPKTVNRKP
ncbi:MAG: hypothetical protein DMF67_02560 [Acidobacteria bacterium]|nr:MAG: hypothetical protein DMF67_02560 [Acidobacteriota bacterium]